MYILQLQKQVPYLISKKNQIRGSGSLPKCHGSAIPGSGIEKSSGSGIIIRIRITVDFYRQIIVPRWMRDERSVTCPTTSAARSALNFSKAERVARILIYAIALELPALVALIGQQREMVFCLNPSHIVQIERIKFFLQFFIIIY